MSDAEIRNRKDAHIDVCLEEDVGSSGLATGLSGYTLEYDALPELDLAQVDLQTELFGRDLKAPLFVGAMTGGSERAGAINHILARAAARVGDPERLHLWAGTGYRATREASAATIVSELAAGL